MTTQKKPLNPALEEFIDREQAVGTDVAMRLLGCSYQHLLDLIKEDADMPQPAKFGARLKWSLRELTEYIEVRKKKTRVRARGIPRQAAQGSQAEGAMNIVKLRKTDKNDCTEAEAAERWCPFGRIIHTSGMHYSPTYNLYQGDNSDVGPQPRTVCLGSRCMAWRWTDHEVGHCGLAGR